MYDNCSETTTFEGHLRNLRDSAPEVIKAFRQIAQGQSQHTVFE